MNNNEIFVSLAVGTSSVTVIIAEVIGEQLNVIGVGNVPSEGIKKGIVIDIDKAVVSIKNAIREAERMGGVEISQVVVGVSSMQVALEPCHGIVAINGENREITNEDIWNVMDAAQVVPLRHDREVISVIPRQYIVDGLDGITDPRGMIGVRLEMKGTLITGSKTILHNMLRCVERSGLEITEIILQPLAEASIALTEDDKEFGTALVNVGAGTTTVSVFDQGELAFTGVIPCGGNSVTKDLSLGLNTSTMNSEKVKLKHGYAFYDNASPDETFQVEVIGSNQRQNFTQVQIAEIIEARMEEIFRHVQDMLKEVGFTHLQGGYVFTGGAMSTPGALDLAAKTLSAHVRLAMPDYIGVRDPAFTTGVGLIKYAYQLAEVNERRDTLHKSEWQYDEEAQPKQPKQTKSKKPEGQKVTAKVKNFFNTFFE